MDDVCVLFSGGVESAMLLSRAVEQAEDDVHPVYVRSGFTWEDVELDYARRYVEAVDAPDVAVVSASVDDVYPDFWGVTGDGVPDAGDEDGHYIPGRNLLLYAKAGLYASSVDADVVFHGTLASNDFADGSREFVEAMERATSLALSRDIEIRRPFSGLVKHEVVSRAVERGLPLEHTLSCLAPVDGVHCGRCLKCADRREAFERAGVADPVGYADDL